MGRGNLMRFFGRHVQKIGQGFGVFLGIAAFVNAVQMREIGIADPVAFKHHVIADGRQQPVDRLLRGLVAGQPHPPGMADQIVVAEIGLDL